MVYDWIMRTVDTESPLNRLERLWAATCTPPAPEGGYERAFDDWTEETANYFPALMELARAALWECDHRMVSPGLLQAVHRLIYPYAANRPEKATRSDGLDEGA